MTSLPCGQLSQVQDQLCLPGHRIELVALQPEHAEALFKIGHDPTIWKYLPRRVTSRDEMTAWVAEALHRRDLGVDLPFVVLDRTEDRIIGETRLIDYKPEHRQIEIAWTWFAPHAWSRGYNSEAKLLLLRFCFETLDVIRVEITTHACNDRGRRSLERLGATLEGILRQNRIMPDGQVRDSAYYSVLVNEWPSVESRLIEILRRS